MKTPRPVDREIARFREIVADTNDALLLAEGSAHPDAALLDLCAEALHLLSHAERAKAAGRALFGSDECRPRRAVWEACPARPPFQGKRLVRTSLACRRHP